MRMCCALIKSVPLQTGKSVRWVEARSGTASDGQKIRNKMYQNEMKPVSADASREAMKTNR